MCRESVNLKADKGWRGEGIRGNTIVGVCHRLPRWLEVVKDAF